MGKSKKKNVILFDSKKKKKKKNKSSKVRCFQSHPAILINGIEVFGGSCSSPVVKDADIYVGLDAHYIEHTSRSYPWVDGESFLFEIKDMSVPKNPEEFAQLISYLSTAISVGLKVHIGCIGGHGRTGMVLSALVATMMNTPNPIKYVRDNYCKKAVETDAQIEFLKKYFDCVTVSPTKGFLSSSDAVQWPPTATYLGSSVGEDWEGCVPPESSEGVNPACVWGPYEVDPN